MTDRTEYNRQWYADNIEHLREYWKEYREKNREERNAYLREWRAKRRKEKPVKQLSMLKEVPAVVIEETPKPHIISAEQVRKEDKLDRPKVAHVCHFYPPAMRCLCGKKQDSARLVTS
jgi:hypothetical protein